MTASTTHPRPLLARDSWLDLCGEWEFAYDDGDVGVEGCWFDGAGTFDRRIQVPFPPESPASGIADTGFHRVVWYRRSVSLPPAMRGRRFLLHCGAIDYRSSIWINGTHAIDHAGGMTPIGVEITPHLAAQGEQILVIRAEDRPEDRTQPRGKQDWQERPHDIWYERTTGIWQPIWLEPVGDTWIREVRWTPDLPSASVGMSVALEGDAVRDAELGVRLEVDGTVLAETHFSVMGDTMGATLALDPQGNGPASETLLWSPENPVLIDAIVSLRADGRSVDEVRSYFGFRSVVAEGGRFLLNGRPYYLRLALEQGYWPESHLAPPSEEAMRREVLLAKELGFNGIRIHQKVEDPRFLSRCDRLGLLVFGEMANALEYSRAGAERLTHEWIEVLARDYNHPCIAAWVPVNESWGVPALAMDPEQRDLVRALYHLTRGLDPTRPVIANDGWEFVVGDMAAIHDYTFSGEVIRERYASPEALERTFRGAEPAGHAVALVDVDLSRLPVILSEFGGLSYQPEPGVAWYGYGTVSDAAAFEAKYRELVTAVLECPGLAGFCYTQLTDTAQETNGLLTASREPKLDPAVIRAINVWSQR